MFRSTDRQSPLFSTGNLMPEATRAAVEKSWAKPFREKVLPILLRHEGEFAALYDGGNGRPNKSVGLILGTLILKEVNDLTDEEVIGSLDFDRRWEYAFDVEPGTAHVCQKTLHNFRAGLINHGKERLIFRQVTDELIPLLGVSVSRQRLDSTHVLSNFAKLTRLGVFCETIRVFLSALKKRDARLYAELPGGILKRHGEESCYADARHEQGPRRLAVAARDTYRLVERFKDNDVIDGLEEYEHLKRVLAERCEIVETPPRIDPGDDDLGEGPVPVTLKEAKDVESDSLQTPHNPGVTYSGHKGSGYEVQIAETCVKDNPVNLITEVQVNPSAHNDARATIPVIEALKDAGIAPEEMATDTAYGGAKNAANAATHGVNLLAPCPAKGRPDPDKTYPVPSTLCPRTPEEAGEWLKQQEAQPDFQDRYAIRAGVEGTHSGMKRGQGLGRLRVRGTERVRLSVHFKATACNIKRSLAYWLDPKRLGSTTARAPALA